jgi:uncharacterized protein Yka (UPF0111/DUF47 family)
MIDLMPKDQKFYDEIEELAAIVAKASKHLVEVTKNFPSVGMHVGEIEKGDQRADEVAQAALERLDQAFITPLDREDILHLISDLYAVVETIAAFAKRVTLYGFQRIDPDLAQQVEILSKVADCLEEVMRRLRRDHRLKTLNGQLRELHQLERRADDQRVAFLGRLFEGNPNPLEVMKKKELHDLIETAIGNCENVSRTLQRVVLKNS